MPAFSGPEISNLGLILHLDAANPKSYPGTGTTWYDLCGNTNNGTLINNPALINENNGSFSFNGVDNYINTSFDLSWNNTNSVTISFAIKPTSLSGYYPFLGKGPTNWEWQFIQSNNNLEFVYWNTTGGHTNGPIPSIPNIFTNVNSYVCIDTVWNHIDNKLYFYKNKVLVYTVSWTNASINQNRTDGIKIGGNIYQWITQGKFWNGKFSNLRIYNRALSPLEIRQNFEAHRDRYGI